ncbi:hypothetical protein Tco_0002626 [Tanacetum coccineum]
MRLGRSEKKVFIIWSYLHLIKLTQHDNLSRTQLGSIENMLETDITQKDEKQSQKRQNWARNGKGCAEWEVCDSNTGSVVATENTGSDVVGMENEDSVGDGTVNGGVGYGEVIRTQSQAVNVDKQQVRQLSVESPNLEKPNNNQETFNPPIVTMADNRTMAQLLEAPTEGYEDAIVVPEITANNFEIKHGLLNLTYVRSRSPYFTPFEEVISMEEIDAFLDMIDSIPQVKSSCEDPPDLELKDLPSHLEYAFLERWMTSTRHNREKLETGDKNRPDQGS